MKQPKIIRSLLLPPRQDAAKAVHPTMRSLHNPTARFEAGFMFDRLRLFTARLDVSRISKLLHQITHRIIIIALVQAHTLRVFSGRFRPFHRDTPDRSFNQFAIVPVSSINRQTDRHSGRFGQQASLNAFFGPIRRVWAGFFPRPAGPSSSRRPSTAKTSRFLVTRRTLSAPWPRAFGKLRQPSIPGIGGGPTNSNRFPWHSTHSIDSLSARRRKLHPWHSDREPVAYGSPADGVCAEGAMVPSCSTVHLTFATCPTYVLYHCFSSVNLPWHTSVPQDISAKYCLSR